MSLVQTLQYELSAQIPRSSSSHQEPQLQPSMDTMPATPDHQNGFQDDIVDENTPIPAEVARRIFDVAPLNVMNKSRRVVITSLVIFSNLVQV